MSPLPRDEALLELGRALLAWDYHFTAVTPATHAQVLARASDAIHLRDVFGWNRVFTAALSVKRWPCASLSRPSANPWRKD